MSIYQRIKQTVTTRQAAERYGLSVNQSGMARCPFHEDHNPSMKVDNRFYSWGSRNAAFLPASGSPKTNDMPHSRRQLLLYGAKRTGHTGAE